MIFRFHTHPKIITVSLVVVLLVGILILIFRNTSIPQAPHSLTVAATINSLADIAQNVVGDEATVVRLVPPGASPHSYTFTPQDISTLQSTRVLFGIGHGLDDWSGKPAAQAVNIPFVTVDSNIPLRTFGEDGNEYDHGHEPGAIDPHYWLAVPNAKIIAINIARTMGEIDPDHQQTYQDNLAVYLEELDTLEIDLQAQAETASQKHFIAMHDAWSYFAKNYGFELVATYEPIEGREPSITDLGNIQTLARQYDITAFYAEPQKQSNTAVQFLRQQLNLDIKTLDVEGGVLDRKTYADLMRFNMRQLTE